MSRPAGRRAGYFLACEPCLGDGSFSPLSGKNERAHYACGGGEKWLGESTVVTIAVRWCLLLKVLRGQGLHSPARQPAKQSRRGSRKVHILSCTGLLFILYSLLHYLGIDDCLFKGVGEEVRNVDKALIALRKTRARIHYIHIYIYIYMCIDRWDGCCFKARRGKK